MWFKMSFLHLDLNICEVMGHLLKRGCSDWSATYLYHSLFNDKLVRSNKKQIRRCKASCDLVVLYIIKHFLWSILFVLHLNHFLILFVINVCISNEPYFPLYSVLMDDEHGPKTENLQRYDHTLTRPGVAVEFHWWKAISCWFTSPF